MKKILGLIIAALLISLIPGVNAQAASDPAKAEKALTKYAEKLAVDYAEAGYNYDFYYALYDINEDGIPELFCQYTGDEEDPSVFTAQSNLKIFGYNGKIKLLKHLTNVNGVKINNKKLILYYDIMEDTGEGFSFAVEYRYEIYSLTKSGKLKLKTMYRSVNTGDGAWYKNDKEISYDKFWDYVSKVDYYEEVYINNTCREAAEITEFNSKASSCDILLAFYSYQWMLNNQADPKTKYTATLEKYTGEDGTGRELVDSVTITSDEIKDVDWFATNVKDLIEPKKLGKFDLSELAILDTEQVEFVETVETSERYKTVTTVTFKTTLRPSNASIVLPGFEYPGDKDVQAYNLFGTYRLDSSTGILTAEFAYSHKAVDGEYATGLMIPLAIYTIKAE